MVNPEYDAFNKMNALNKEMPFVESGIPPGCVRKVCGSVV